MGCYKNQNSAILISCLAGFDKMIIKKINLPLKHFLSCSNLHGLDKFPRFDQNVFCFFTERINSKI